VGGVRLALAFVLVVAACAPRVPAPAPDARQCLVELDRLGVRWEPAPIDAAVSACTVANPVRVSAAGAEWNQPGIVACRFAVSLDSFTRESIEPLAREYFGLGVNVVEHFGTYACRTTSGGHDSLHAVGEAIDIAGFELADGTRITVAHDWYRADAYGQFLRAVARAACGRFSLVLSPDSDRDHDNHIHIDAGPYHHCGVRGA
jgi:hypothetical protein